MFLVAAARSIAGEGVVTGVAGAMTVAALLTCLEDYGKLCECYGGKNHIDYTSKV